jgi:hypothetical protein
LVLCGLRSEKISSNQTSTLPVDTLMADNFLLTFGIADSFKMSDIYGDNEYRIQLTDKIGNCHKKADKIQEYLKNKFGDCFYTTDSTLVLRLLNNKTEIFPLWDAEKDEGYNFEHYFANIDYYLLRVQWGEGNCWMLVNRKNGFKKYISGLPYISKNKQKILTINSDLEAGYSFNGLELFSIEFDSLKTEFRKKTIWGPTNVKWINGNQFLIKREHFHVDSLTGIQNNIIDYKTVTIEKKTCQ